MASVRVSSAARHGDETSREPDVPRRTAGVAHREPESLLGRPGQWSMREAPPRRVAKRPLRPVSLPNDKG